MSPRSPHYQRHLTPWRHPSTVLAAAPGAHPAANDAALKTVSTVFSVLTGALLWIVGMVTPMARADSIVVFNEVMYHPLTNDAALEWVELRNQLAVDVDLSNWSLTGGIECQFPDGTAITGGGYLVVAASPTVLAAAAGLTNVVGPFTNRLSNSGEKIELRNQTYRLMDRISYGADGDWPVGPDGSGVSLAKQDEEAASPPAQNWTMSAQVGGTPGRRNFPAASFEVTNTVPVSFSSYWRLAALDTNLDVSWTLPQFNDAAWSSGQSLFRLGSVAAPQGNLVSIPTVFSTGVGADGVVLSPGSSDPHYRLTLSAQTTPPPPAIPATVILNHPAWLANDSTSSWIGPVNPGESSVAAGAYNYLTSFNLDGFNPASARLSFNVGADNQLLGIVFNGVSNHITYAGFSSLSGTFSITNGFVAGSNSLQFYTQNDGDSANPAGFRVRLSGLARQQYPVNTSLPIGKTNCCFRTQFTLGVAPRFAAIQLSAIVADGAVFYLNGTEVLRWNMPPGAVGPNTLATSNVPSPTVLGPFALPNSALVMGTNVLAVELHSAGGLTNDLLFGAQLDLSATNVLVPPPMSLAFNEIGSATNGDVFVELINYGSSSLNLSGCVLSRQGGTTNREFVFPAQTLSSGALATFPKTALGFGADPGDRLFLYGPGRNQVLDAVVAKERARARCPDGTGPWAFPSALSPGASNVFQFHNEVVINEILFNPPLLPSSAATFATNVLLQITNSWKYNSLGLNLGTAWRATAYDDSAWPAGRALLYNSTSVLPADKNTELPLVASNGTRIVTWYFRSPFRFSGTTNSALLFLRPIIDDGAVYYLNGIEIYRQNMPAGDVLHTTLASSGVATPAYAGPYTVTVTNLVRGTNLLAVEVHQFTTNPIAADMAFGVEVSLAGQFVPALPNRDSSEAWVELLNRSTNTVDLTGWRLDEGIDFRFPSGTSLASGGYLVVAKDVAFMQSNYPGIMVLGPFTNQLSHKSDFIALKDASNNIANAVRYYDGKPWPEAADGGGSSLELRDPWADNAKPEAWSASNESARSGWSNYTYTAVAKNVIGPTVWKEFVIGLLDAGECLIDDLHVVESPTGSPVELLQNGTFETGLAAWRALGDHGASRVEVDPDNAANHVLHLVATGPTDHMHNHLETTLANSRSVVDGRTYRVSFRAKWLSGNNRLNTRLYFNRVAKTFVLPLPTQHGTPGAPNSTLTNNIGPTFESLSHSPVVPKANQSVLISVNATDPQGVQSVTLWTSVNGGSWQSRPMLPGSGVTSPGYTNYTAIFPGQSAGAIVQFYVRATDSLGAVSTFPAGGTNSRALFKVNDGTAVMSQLHRFRLIMPPADVALLHASTNVMSNDRMGLTVIYDENQVFYDVGVHLQGSERGRDATSRVGFTVKFHADQLFRGVQDGVTFDRSGGYSGIGGTHDEILLWHAVNHAGNLYGLDCDLAQVFAPRSQENGTALMRMLAFDNDYFDNQFQDGGDGGHYLLELIYYPTTTYSGDAQSPKLPQPDDVINTDFQNWGTDPEIYRWIFLRENLTDFDDYSQVIALNQALSLTTANFEAQTSQIMEADEWLRTLAFKAFIGDVDTFTVGYSHNWKFYFRPDTGQAIGLLWDMDFSFVQPVNNSYPGSSSANTYRFIMLPNNYRRYCNHLLDILTTTINSAHLTPWAKRYAGLLGQDWSAVVSYLQQRASYIKSTLPQGGAFAITSNGGKNFATTNNPVTLTGTAPLTVHDITINGVSRPLRWTSTSTWTLSAPLPARINVLTAQGFDSAGKPVTNAAVSITVTNLGILAPVVPVVINEWMADNAGPGGFEDPIDGLYQDWFELYNPNSIAINLSGYYLTDTLSQPTKWQIPTNITATIAPYGFLVVWADGDTGQNGLGTNGDLHADFQLSRGGEAIGLFASDGTVQHTVTFGAQIQNVSQGLFPDGDTNACYFMTNWSPRAANRLGTLAAPQLSSCSVQTNGTLLFQAGVVPYRTYQLQYKSDLAAQTWTPLGDPQTATSSLLVFSDTITNQPQRFYRIVLVP